MISITSAPEAPAPRIRILDTRNREVETVRIGDKLTFRIEIPEESMYLKQNHIDFYLMENFALRGLLSYSSIKNWSLFFSTLWNICQKLCGHGEGFEKYLPDHRWRWVNSNYWFSCFNSHLCINQECFSIIFIIFSIVWRDFHTFFIFYSAVLSTQAYFHHSDQMEMPCSQSTKHFDSQNRMVLFSSVMWNIVLGHVNR